MTALIILVIAIWVAAFLLNWKRPFLIGKRGENFVSRELLELDSEHYNVLDDLMLPSLGNTNTTEIDHIVVSDFGIFCIETKIVFWLDIWERSATTLDASTLPLQKEVL